MKSIYLENDDVTTFVAFYISCFNGELERSNSIFTFVLHTLFGLEMF